MIFQSPRTEQRVQVRKVPFAPGAPDTATFLRSGFFESRGLRLRRQGSRRILGVFVRGYGLIFRDGRRLRGDVRHLHEFGALKGEVPQGHGDLFGLDGAKRFVGGKVQRGGETGERKP